MRPAGLPASRRSRTGLIVSIALVALVLVGGGVTALMLLSQPTQSTQGQVPKPVVGGRYQSLIKCGALTRPPFTFDPHDEPYTSNGGTDKICMGTFGAQRVDVAMAYFSGPNGEARAVQASAPISLAEQDFQRINGTGFENSPFVGYNGDYGALCTATYRRSNLTVRMDFPDLPGVTDTAGCTSAIMPYVKQLYAAVG